MLQLKRSYWTERFEDIDRRLLLLRERESPTEFDLRDAVPRPQTWDEANRTIEATIATTTRVQRRDATGPYLEILDPAGLDVAATRGVSVLNAHGQHDLNQIVGVVDDVWVAGDEVRARIRFSDREDVAPFVEDIRSGIIRFLSVGYEVREWRDGTERGQRTRTAARWVAREVSFVPVPADPRSRTRATRDLPRGERAEVNRQIRALGTRAGVSSQVINDLIDNGVSVGEAREAILFEMQVRGSAHIETAHNRTTLDNPEFRRQVLGEALFARMNPRHTPTTAARQFVALTIPEMARECLARAGVVVQGASAVSLIERALNTTSDFPLLLQDAIDKSLRLAYQVAPGTLRRLSRETSAPDFKTRHRLQVDSGGLTLEKVNEHGEFKSSSIGVEEDQTYKLATYGRVVGVTRQLMVNDDLGALNDLSRRLGTAVSSFEAQSLTDLLVSNAGVGPTMTDTKALFHTDHGNLAASGAVPSDTTLKAARLAMRRQKGLAGEVIVVEPRYVVVPPDLETDTQKLLTTIQAMAVSDVNVWGDSNLTLLVEPRLTDTYRWYVVGDTAGIDGLEHCYLSGSQGPQLASRVGFDVDGMELRIREDWACAFVEHRGWYMNPGH